MLFKNTVNGSGSILWLITELQDFSRIRDELAEQGAETTSLTNKLDRVSI